MLRTRLLGTAVLLYVAALVPALLASETPPGTLDGELAAALSAAGFTGTIQQT